VNGWKEREKREIDELLKERERKKKGKY